VKLKITSDIKNNCISDDRITDPMSGYMTEGRESNSQLHVKKNTELHYHYYEYFQRYF
jgi:hypothetical protein